MKKLLAIVLALALCAGLCVPALAAADTGAGLLPVTPDFYFSSGVGAWATVCTLHTDGTFEGSYHDSNMGDTGDGYPNGTVYVSSFYGAFDHITQVDAYTWSMKLASLNTLDVPGREWIEDGIKYIADVAVGMPDVGGEVLLYLPGHDRASLSEDFLMWTMFSGSGNNDAPELDFFGLYNVADSFGFGSSLEDSQIAQGMQAYITAGTPQRLVDLAAYYGDSGACRMTAGQAEAFAGVIQEQISQLNEDMYEYGFDYGYIASYAALFDLGNGIPALFFAGGQTTWENESDDGCLWSDVGSYGIWLYENGEAVKYEPPHGGLTLALFPSALFVGGYQGSDGTTYDGRVYAIRDGGIADEPELIAQANFENGTFALNGSAASEAEFTAARDKWDESLSLAGHSYGGGVEGYIWGMCGMNKMLTVLDAYAGAVSGLDMPDPSQQPEQTPDQSDAPASSDSPAPEKGAQTGKDKETQKAEAPGEDDEPEKKGASAVPAAAMAVVAAAGIAGAVVMNRKKKPADGARSGSVPPAGNAGANAAPAQPRTPGTPQDASTSRDAQTPQSQRPVNFCSQCGSKVQPGHRFCPKCGNPLR